MRQKSSKTEGNAVFAGKMSVLYAARISMARRGDSRIARMSAVEDVMSIARGNAYLRFFGTDGTSSYIFTYGRFMNRP